MKLAEIGEFGFIERIRQRAGGAGVRLAIGDDCAAVEVRDSHLQLTSKDLLIEGVHFRRDWTDLYRLGRKSVSVNVSDVAAMGGNPEYLFLGLAMASTLTVEDLDTFVDGFLAAAQDYGVRLIGGDTCRSPGPLIISVTVQGSVPAEQMICRSGARPGDAVYVSGTLGDSGLALQLLQAGQPLSSQLSARHHDPRARTELGRALAAAHIPSAMIDLSDGLLADLGHVLTASGAGAHIDAEALPLSVDFQAALSHGQASLDLALAGGEDYELLFTVPASREDRLAELSRQFKLDLTRIGYIGPLEDGLKIRRGSDEMAASGRKGYNHFS
ncbi:thiamine-phosphate kinase [Desulfuromonas sp. AOP6]|uniref:thiamine-phosphate kinase n=1 Tax=Desulfuromonas sp. AOP6 TaxID=1566351 RepID=UPI001270B738|nr:thiamine-phosphate kinase [Desulfuromonas sp. AOP6]BCA81045.1 thiamine-monophosphate kinase [Desulfuromonas sp. AOP6]